MDSEQQPQVINTEEDSLESVAAKLGAKEHLEFERIYLAEKYLKYINNDIDDSGNTILMRFVFLGKDDIVEFLMKCDGIGVNDTNKEEETAAEIAWEKKQFKCLLHLLRGDANFPYELDKTKVDDHSLKDFLDQRDMLHELIESGDLLSIKEALKDTKPCKYLNLKRDPSTKNQSALSLAAECEKLEIFAYLLAHGAKFKDEEEESECNFNNAQTSDLNDLLSENFVKLDDSYILKLMHSSHSPQVLTEIRRDKIRNLYEYLNRSEILRTMMQVLEYEGVDVVFDFECDHTNRIYCLNNCQIEGLTVTSVKKIFIAAKKSEMEENVNLEVAGTLAHEFCHMAVQVVYKNDAKPYEYWEENKECESEKVVLYRRIVKEIYWKSQDSTEKIDPIIAKVFDNYYKSMWESEMIVRIPHILAYYGDAKGRELLQNQVQELFQFYLSELMPKFREYSNPMFFLKQVCIAEVMNKYLGCLTEDDREIAPLKEPAKSYKNFLVAVGYVSVIFTSNTRLCCLHVYHELKKCHPYHMEKKCLFFSLDCFERNSENILRAFKSRVCESMVLVSNKKVLRLMDIDVYFDDFLDRINEKNPEMKKQVIIILEKKCRLLPNFIHGNVLSYDWNELSELFMCRLMNLKIDFKGTETNLCSWLCRGKVKQIIQSNEILLYANQQEIHFGDGERLIRKGFVRDYYIERIFFRVFFEENVFQGLTDSIALIITGCEKDHLHKMEGLQESSIHWMDSFLNIDHRKRLFFPLWKWDSKEVFADFCNRIPSIDAVYWLHFYQNKLYLRMKKGANTFIDSCMKEEVLSEEDLISFSKERIILVSDDPGMGKSTVITNIITRMREVHPDWWVGRIDLNDYSDSKENPLGLAHIERESESDYILEIFIQMLGINGKLEICLFREFIKPRGLDVKFKVFLDGYDEVSSLYSENILRLFEVLIVETNLQIWVTTRNHDKIILETTLDSCSYAMKEFDFENQVEFLDRFWKYRTKHLQSGASEVAVSEILKRISIKVEDILRHMEYEDSGLLESLCPLKEVLMSNLQQMPTEKLNQLRHLVDKSNFSDIATDVIRSSSIGHEESKFMGTPLHLFMLGNVVYDSNFRRGVYSNVYKLYTEFVEGKIKIYWKEKGKVEMETSISQKLFLFHRKEIINFHKDISQCVVEPVLYSWSSFMANEDRDTDLSVGIVTRGADNFRFIHKTFAEYFFAEKILEKLKSRILDGGTMERILTKVQYSVVVRFLYWALESELGKGIMTKDNLSKWNMFSIMKSCLTLGVYLVPEAKYLLKIFVQEMIKLCDLSLINHFVSKIAGVQVINTIHSFKILIYCLTDSMIFDIFETHSDRSHDIVFSMVDNCSAEDTKEVFDYLFRIFIANKGFAGFDSSENPKAGKNCPRFLLITNRDNANILFYATSNRDKEVFPYVLNLLKEYLSIDELKTILTCVNVYQENILHKTARYFMDNAVSVIKQIAKILDADELIPMLRSKSYKEYNFLYGAVKYNKTYILRELFETLRVLSENEIFREIILDGASDENIIHYAVANGEIEGLVVVLENVKQIVTVEEFLELIRSFSSYGNIFHGRALYGHPIADLIVLKSFVSEEIFREMLLEVNQSGKTCLHEQYSMFGSACLTRSPRFKQCVDIIVHDLRFLAQVLDQNSFREFILNTDKHGNSIFHFMADNTLFKPHFGIVIHELKNVLGNRVLEALLAIRNDSWEVVEVSENGHSVKLKSTIPENQ